MTVDAERFDDSDAADSRRPDPGRVLCAAFIDVLPIGGASISLVTETGVHSIIGTSDPLAAELEAWQFGLGLGPHWEALRTEQPAFLYDTGPNALHRLWPSLMVHGVPDGAGALFAFPLHLGTATVGVADLYSPDPSEPWSASLIETARDVVIDVTAAAVRLATRSAHAVTSTTGDTAVELRREVHQATGMVMGQLDCSASTALLRLRAYAFFTGIPLETLAREVIARRLDFAHLDEPPYSARTR